MSAVVFGYRLVPGSGRSRRRCPRSPGVAGKALFWEEAEKYNIKPLLAGFSPFFGILPPLGTRAYLSYTGRLLDARTTLAEHRCLLVTGGWLSLLAAT